MKLLIIQRNADDSYNVNTYAHADGSADTVIYSTLEDVQKVLPVISKDLSGLSKDSDRVTIFFNEDGTIDKIDAHVFSATRDDAPEVAVIDGASIVSQGINTAIDTLKTDVATKTGEDLPININPAPADPPPPQ